MEKNKMKNNNKYNPYYGLIHRLMLILYNRRKNSSFVRIYIIIILALFIYFSLVTRLYCFVRGGIFFAAAYIECVLR